MLGHGDGAGFGFGFEFGPCRPAAAIATAGFKHNRSSLVFNGDGALGAGFGCETAVCEVRMLRKTNSGTEATGCTTAKF